MSWCLESDKMNTAIYYSPKFLEHDLGLDHPDTPNRLRVIMEEMKRSGLFETEKCVVIDPKPAQLEDLELVHKFEYIELVKKICASIGGLFDLGDTVVSPKSYEAAVLAVGALIDAVNMVVDGKAKNAFALVRPPGHHAGAYYALGFCLFNNIAIAASHLLHRLDYSRVLILDIDAHHGNGTQEIFYSTRQVLYISLHQDLKAFPGTGLVKETGDGEGVGYTVNVPLPLKTNDAIYVQTFEDIVTPIAHQYKPEFILVSAGFDGHYKDPVGRLSLSMKCYEDIFTKIVALSTQLCQGRLVVTLEGGYSPSNFLGKMATVATAKMADVMYHVEDNIPEANPRTLKEAEQIINSVKHIQSSFWRL